MVSPHLPVYAQRCGAPYILFHDDRKVSPTFLFEKLGTKPWKLLVGGIIMKENVIKSVRERALEALIIFFCGGLSKGL